jgi:hypothetical protein
MRYVFAVLLLSCSTFAQNDTQQLSQTLSESQLPQADQTAIQHRLKLSDANSLKIGTVDLNEDDTPEVLAQSADTKSFWILQKKGTDYKVLLKAMAQSYRVRTIKTGGFQDVELGRSDSDYRTEWRGYKYDGKRYVKVKCWANVTGDGEHEYPKPKVEPCKKK